MQYPQLKNNNSHSLRIFMKTSHVIEAAKRFSKPYRITNGKKFRLTDVDPDDSGELTSEDKPRAKEALQTGVQALAELQDVLYGGGRPTRAFEVKYRSQTTGLGELQGIQQFCAEKKVPHGYVITKGYRRFQRATTRRRLRWRGCIENSCTSRLGLYAMGQTPPPLTLYLLPPGAR
jgi:hypothetical protein